MSRLSLPVSIEHQSPLADVGRDPVVDDHGRPADIGHLGQTGQCLPQQSVLLDLVVESNPTLLTQDLTDDMRGDRVNLVRSYPSSLQYSSVCHGSSQGGQTLCRAVGVAAGVLSIIR